MMVRAKDDHFYVYTNFLAYTALEGHRRAEARVALTTTPFPKSCIDGASSIGQLG